MFLAAMCSIPFLLPYHQAPITSFAGEWMAVALGVLAGLPVLTMRRTWQPLPFPLVALLPLGMAGVVALQVVSGMAVYWQQHMLFALYLVWAATMVVLGAVLRREAGLSRVACAMSWGLLAAGLASAIVLGLQLAGVDAPHWVMPRNGRSMFANLGQANHLANLLGLALASLSYLAVTRRISVGLAIIFAIVLVSSLALTGSRSGWLYLAVMLILSWVSGSRIADGQGRLLVRGALAFVALFGALQFVLPILLAANAPLMPSEKVIAAAAGGSARLQLLQVAWQAFLTSPWLGAGFGQYGWHDLLLGESVPHALGRVMHAHNLFAQMLAEGGVAGSLVLGAGLALWVYHGRRAAWSCERWWLLALLGVLFVHSMLEHPLWHAYFLGVAAFLLGLGEEKTLDMRFDLGPLLGAAFAAFGAFSLFNVGQHYIRVEQYYLMNRQQLSAAVQQELPALRGKGLMTPYLDLVLVRILPDAPELVRDKLALHTRVVRFIPDRREAYHQATLLALNGRKDEAMTQLRYALARHPDAANAYAVRLLRKADPATMPLLSEALRFDLARRPVSGLRVENGRAFIDHAHKSGKTPDPIRENSP